MRKEKSGRIGLLLSLVLIAALLLPMSPATVVEDAQAVTQADIDKLKKESASIASQRKEVQSKLAATRAEKGKLTDQKGLLEDDIDLIQQNIASIQERIEGIQAQIAGIEAQIASTQGKIDSLQGQIEELDAEISDYITQIEIKQGELEEAEAEEAELYELFCQRVRLMEEQGQVSYWSILFSSDSFSDLLDNFLMVREFMDYDNEIMNDLQELQERIQAEKANLEEIKANLEQARSEVQAAKEEQEAAKREQEAAKAAQEAAKREQEAAQQEQVSAQQDLKGQEAEVQKLIDAISVTEQELEAEESALKKAAASADARIRQMEKELAPKISSVKAEGSFSWPLPGKTRLSSLFGGRIHPITGRPNNHTGIDIPAGYGTSIKCAKSGVVTISMRGPSYGNYVVVSHSDGTSTLYAHMSSRSVSVGQSVKQGQELGKVGSTGSSTGNHLHFEIRVNGSRVDPVNYFSGLTVSSRGKTVRLN